MGERYFITGATGLVGGALAEYLAKNGEDVTVFVRDEEKAKKIFSGLSRVSIVAGSIDRSIEYDGEVDYIIHAAAPTNSNFFIEHPVETIDSIVLGTKSALELARQKKVKSMVNLSSMEMYGTPTEEEDLTEDKQFYLDPLNIRSDYPMAKRLAETMCASYATEYNVPVKTARLAQVLGERLLPDDNRVIAQFIRSAKNRKNITLATDGSTKQTYVSIGDAIQGVLTILKKGADGQSYNLANDETYSSIREMAEIVAYEIAGGEIEVEVGVSDDAKYPPTRTLRINSDKLRRLGWEPADDLRTSLKRLAENQQGDS